MINNDDTKFTKEFIKLLKNNIDEDFLFENRTEISKELNLRGLNNVNSDDIKKQADIRRYCIQVILESIIKDQQLWFDHTSFTRSKLSTDVSVELEMDDNIELLCSLFAMLYELFLTLEPSKSLNQRLVDILFAIKNSPNVISDNNLRLSHYAESFPIFLNKKLINDPILTRLSTLDNDLFKVNEIYQKITKQEEAWEQNFEVKQSKIEAQEKRLKQHQSNLNFMLLSKGFSDIEYKKQSDLTEIEKKAKFWSRFTVLTPAVTTIISLVYLWNDKNLDLTFFAPAATLLIIFSTFYRVALTEVKSLKSQLVQLELRKALCQFVEDYSIQAEKINSSSPETLKRFEDVIFSSIVLSEDKIPSTFDGMDQVKSILKNIGKG